MFIRKIFLYLNTIKYLKISQIFYRFYYFFLSIKNFSIPTGLKPIKLKNWKHLSLYDEKIDEELNTSFLNIEKKLNLPEDWNNSSFDKLWLYNLHYFEDLLSKKAHLKHKFHISLINSWIEDNPLKKSVGWEPYPTSLRIVNIIKSWLGGLALDIRVFESLYLQASHLSRFFEKHLLGNHYFSNLKALLFAGVIFQNQKWIYKAHKGLLNQIPEQILNDGANFELSPMYHSLFLVDILDIYNLCSSYTTKETIEIKKMLNQHIPKMIRFMESMSHPDGKVSFFNDSVFGVAPEISKILDYAYLLGFEEKAACKNIIDNKESGYLCFHNDEITLIFDAGKIGPSYIPGHAHADTLSFELSIFGERIIVNSGIYEYLNTKKRIFQRKTMSHNTVEIDSKDSSEVWSSFRVANRAIPLNRFSTKLKDNSIIFNSGHNGYSSFFSKTIHNRKIHIFKNSIRLTDTIVGKFKTAKSRLYFHPNHELINKVKGIEISNKLYKINIEIPDHKYEIKNSFWSPMFGKEIKNNFLEIDFNSPKIELNISWMPK